MKKSISLTLFIGLAFLKQGLAQTHVQTATLFQTTTATTISRSFAAASTTGNLIVVHLDWDGQTRSISSVTDTKGNTYARISGPTNWNGPNYRAELWYAYNITGGGGAITVTGHLSGAPTSFSQIYISEYSGILTTNPLDQNSVAIGNAAAVSSGAKTTTQNNELIYGASIGASGTLTKGAGFTSRSTANSNIIEDKNVTTTGSYSTTFTSAGGNWVAQMATFKSSIIILPIELLSFTGECKQNKMVLDWTTASETNNDFFTIEFSQDGTDWKLAGTVKSHGNSSALQQYSFNAEPSNQGPAYFRLKQTDLDGKFTYSKTIQVNPCTKNANGVSFYPNPCNGLVLFGRINRWDNEGYIIEIFDNYGKKMSRFNSNQEDFTIRFPNPLPQGIYYARFSSTSYSKVAVFLVKK